VLPAHYRADIVGAKKSSAQAEPSRGRNVSERDASPIADSHARSGCGNATVGRKYCCVAPPHSRQNSFIRGAAPARKANANAAAAARANLFHALFSSLAVWFGPEAAAVRQKVINDPASFVSDHSIVNRHPILCERIGSYNLVSWRKRIFVLHQGLGRVEVEKYDVARLPGVFQAKDIGTARAAAIARQSRPAWRKGADRAAVRVAGGLLRRSPWLQARLHRSIESP
jgi:hypothetical protein